MKGSKLVLSCLVFLCATLSQTSAEGSKTSQALQNDFKEFLDLVPKLRIRAIISKHLKFDNEFKEFVSYIKGEEFKKVYTKIIESPEFHKLAKFFQEIGLDIVYALKSIGIQDFSLDQEAKAPRSLNGFITEIYNALPQDQIIILFSEKLNSSPEFQALFDSLKAKELNELLVDVETLPPVMELLKELKSKGVQIDVYLGFLKSIFGWELAPVV